MQLLSFLLHLETCGPITSRPNWWFTCIHSNYICRSVDICLFLMGFLVFFQERINKVCVLKVQIKLSTPSSQPVSSLPWSECRRIELLSQEHNVVGKVSKRHLQSQSQCKQEGESTGDGAARSWVCSLAVTCPYCAHSQEWRWIPIICHSTAASSFLLGCQSYTLCCVVLCEDSLEQEH